MIVLLVGILVCAVTNGRDQLGAVIAKMGIAPSHLAAIGLALLLFFAITLANKRLEGDDDYDPDEFIDG